MHAISVCLIIRNEARYLAEWLEYHLMIGVEHFYIYDNGSEDDLPQVCARYPHSVTRIPWPEEEGQQRLAYKDYVRRHARASRWTAFIDTDEFIVHKGEGSLAAYLAAREDHNGLLMRWTIFGTGGHVARPAGLVMENYTMTHAVSPNPDVKTICQAAWIDADAMSTPHYFSYLREAPVAQPGDELCLYHFMLRSLEDVRCKVERGDAWNPAQGEKRRRNVEGAIDSILVKYDRTDRRDTYMLRFVPELKRRLAARHVPVASP